MVRGNMRQAIVTRFLGPTDKRDPRVKATAYAGSVTLDWNDSLDIDANHQAAANALADKFDWRNPGNGKRYEFVGGSLPHDGYCFVEVEITRKRKDSK
jgi:hypothetical protein